MPFKSFALKRSVQTMNVFFDGLWWWRQEFRGQPDPFTTLTQPTMGGALGHDLFGAFPDMFSYDEKLLWHV